jgi:hypothetical protein
LAAVEADTRLEPRAQPGSAACGEAVGIAVREYESITASPRGSVVDDMASMRGRTPPKR